MEILFHLSLRSSLHPVLTLSTKHLKIRVAEQRENGKAGGRLGEAWGKPTSSTVRVLTEFCLDRTDFRTLYCPANLNTGQIHVGNIRFINLNIERTTVLSSKV